MNSIALQAKNLSKLYRIGAKQHSYATIRESLMRAAAAPIRMLAAIGRRESGPTERKDTIWALKDVSFDIQAGEVTGIIGRNGAGKSTLLKILSRITDPTHGEANVYGRVGSLLEVGTGFHPELTGRENIFLNGVILGMKRKEIRRKFDEIVDFAEVDKFIDTPVKRYSSGMNMRLAFAVAAHLDPEILLIDEVLAVGDAIFQKKCLGKMEDVARQGRTVLFVSHNMAAVRALCTKGVFLHNGMVGHIGQAGECIEQYLKAIGALNSGDGQDQPAANGDRSPFGPITVNEGTGNTVDASQPLEVATTLRVRNEVGGFYLTVYLEDMRGTHICNLAADSKSLGWSGATGDYEIRLQFPTMWLNPGFYSVYFKVQFWGQDERGRHLSDPFPLDVAGTGAADNAVLNPDAQWSIKHNSSPIFCNG